MRCDECGTLLDDDVVCHACGAARPPRHGMSRVAWLDFAAREHVGLDLVSTAALHAEELRATDAFGCVHAQSVLGQGPSASVALAARMPLIDLHVEVRATLLPGAELLVNVRQSTAGRIGVRLMDAGGIAVEKATPSTSGSELSWLARKRLQAFGARSRVRPTVLRVSMIGRRLRVHVDGEAVVSVEDDLQGLGRVAVGMTVVPSRSTALVIWGFEVKMPTHQIAIPGPPRPPGR